MALTLAAATVVSCQENALDNVEIQAPAEKNVVLTAVAPTSPSTRIDTAIGGSSVTFKWFGGSQWNAPDMLTVYNATTGARVGNFIMEDRGEKMESTTFAAIGENIVSGEASQDVVYDDPTFTLSASESYIAVFPASGAATLADRDAEAINGYQYQNAPGGWQTGMRLKSAEFTTAAPTLTFTHQTALISVDFTAGDTAFPTNFSCSDGVNTANLPIGDLYKIGHESTYTAYFVMYPSTSRQLTFTITSDTATKGADNKFTLDGNPTTTTVVRNTTADIKAGYCYRLKLVEETFTPSGDDLLVNGDFEADKIGGWDIPGINQYSQGFNGNYAGSEGPDGSQCMKYTMVANKADIRKIMFDQLTTSPAPAGLYQFSIDMKCSVDYTVSAKFTAGNNPAGDVSFDDASLVADDWKTLVGTVNLTANNATGFIIPLSDLDPGVVLMFDNAKLIPGTVAQDMPLTK